MELKEAFDIIDATAGFFFSFFFLLCGLMV